MFEHAFVLTLHPTPYCYHVGCHMRRFAWVSVPLLPLRAWVCVGRSRAFCARPHHGNPKVCKVDKNSQQGFFWKINRSKGNELSGLAKKGYEVILTNKSGTNFTHKALKALNADYGELLKAYQTRQSDLEQKFLETVASYSPVLEDVKYYLTNLDLYVCFATVAQEAPTPYCRPTVLGLEAEAQRQYNLKGARHPMLEVQVLGRPHLPDAVYVSLRWGTGKSAPGPDPGGSLGNQIFFLLRTALRDRPKGSPTANHRHQPRQQPWLCTGLQAGEAGVGGRGSQKLDALPGNVIPPPHFGNMLLGGWVGLGQDLMQEQAPGSGRPSLPDHEAEQPGRPVPGPSGLSTAARPHRSAREQETPWSFVGACVQEGWATRAGNLHRGLLPGGGGVVA